LCCNCRPAGQLEDAEVVLRELLGFDLPLSEKLPVLAQLADVQLKEDSVETQAKVAAKLAEAIKAAGGDTSKVCWPDAQQWLDIRWTCCQKDILLLRQHATHIFAHAQQSGKASSC
jgi:hypothetical protein